MADVNLDFVKQTLTKKILFSKKLKTLTSVHRKVNN